MVMHSSEVSGLLSVNVLVTESRKHCDAMTTPLHNLLTDSGRSTLRTVLLLLMFLLKLITEDDSLSSTLSIGCINKEYSSGSTSPLYI